LIQMFLKARFSGEIRHQRRVDKVRALEVHAASR
jgi:ribose 5-phosphate isomerase RpiB